MKKLLIIALSIFAVSCGKDKKHNPPSPFAGRWIPERHIEKIKKEDNSICNETRSDESTHNQKILDLEGLHIDKKGNIYQLVLPTVRYSYHITQVTNQGLSFQFNDLDSEEYDYMSYRVELKDEDTLVTFMTILDIKNDEVYNLETTYKRISDEEAEKIAAKIKACS